LYFERSESRAFDLGHSASPDSYFGTDTQEELFRVPLYSSTDGLNLSGRPARREFKKDAITVEFSISGNRHTPGMIRKLRRDQKNTVSTSSSAESICLSDILEQYILVHAVSTHLNGIFAAALSPCLRPFRHFIVFDQRITACDYFFLRFVVQFLYFLPATHGQQNDHCEIFDSLQLLFSLSPAG
jgi:hypothetical protein